MTDTDERRGSAQVNDEIAAACREIVRDADRSIHAVLGILLTIIALAVVAAVLIF